MARNDFFLRRLLPMGWDWYVAKLRQDDEDHAMDADERRALMNTLRAAHGMSVSGHKLTYHYFVARRSIERLAA